MTWDRIKATGRGKLELRLQIEGLRHEFVTHPDMATAGTVAQRRRVHCLKKDGITLSDSVDMARAEISADGFTAEMVDRQHDSELTSAFCEQPSVVTYLAADLTAAATTGSVLGGAGISSGDVIHIGTEAILLTGFSSVTGAIASCTRGYWGTIAQAHYTADPDTDRIAAAPVYLEKPRSLEGRRAYLYAYGQGDDLTDTAEDAGTLVWRGVCVTDASLDPSGAVWRITIDPITTLMEQTLGAEGATVEPRGIYYSWANPLHISITEYTGTDYRSTPSTTNEINETVYGFFEDNEEFCRYINDNVIDLTGWNARQIEFVPEGSDGWHILFHTSTTTARWVEFKISSDVDGEVTEVRREASPGVWVTATNVATDKDYVVTALSTFGSIDAGLRTVPRGWHGLPRNEDWVRYVAPAGTDVESDYPNSVIYLGGSALPALGDFVDITLPDDRVITIYVDGINTSTRSITVRPYGVAGSVGGWTRDHAITIATKPNAVRGSLDTLRDYVVANSPTLTNKGELPFLTSSDLADWTDEIAAAIRGKRWGTDRNYQWFEPKTFADVLTHELRVINAYPILDSDGKIAIRRLRLVSASTSADATITEDDILIDAGFPVWERNAMGSINTITVRTGYNAQEDDHLGTTWQARDVAGYSERKANRNLEIAPLSEARWPLDAVDDAAEMAAPIFGVFGSDYAVVTVEVSLKHFDTLLGDVIDFSSIHVPDTLTGTRGVSSVRARVIGRSWDLQLGRGSLTLLLSYDKVGGYTPTMYIASEVDNGSDNWTLTVTTQDPTAVQDFMETGDDATSHFAVGDRVRVFEWDDATPSVLDGTITAVQASAIQVDFDSTWTFSASTCLIGYETDAPSGASATQQAYVYIGDADGRIGFSTATHAFRWGP